MSQLDIPKPLIDQIRSGNVILFLGAGASFDALTDDNSSVPRGQELADLLAKEFLDESYLGQSLQTVSELAISERSLRDVQEFVYNLFIKFKPNHHHRQLADFKWRSIYTTNYDFILEEVFRERTDSLQSLNPVIRNTTENEILIDPDRTLPYFKLHGCLSEINDPDLPLILTPDQYINHRKNRDRLFKRFFEDARNYPILFVGYSITDIDIRSYLNQLYAELADNRARSFMVIPSMREAEVRLWQTRKVTPILCDFKSFVNRLIELVPRSSVLSENLRNVNSSPIFSVHKVVVEGLNPTETLQRALTNDLEFVGGHLISTGTSAREFYKGYLYAWDAIIDCLDVPRSDSKLVLSEVFLDENVDSKNQFFYLIEGFAGSGKTVFAKRLLYDAAVDLNKLCFYLREDGVLNYEVIQEIYTLFNERVFLLVDSVHKNDIEIKSLLDKAKRDNLPLTIIGTERTNIWNIDCKTVFPYLTRAFKLTYLNGEEIKGLLGLLEKHNSLNNLKTKTQEERFRAFEERAGRELLVALYEATEGKPFETIVVDEFNNISDPIAQSLYLTVCIFNRLGTYVRAGLISRIHDIPFEDFKDRFFKPLEFIVFDEKNYRINDFVYKTRHPRIAEIIFEQVLSSPANRYDEFIRIISELNIDYQSDRALFLSITNAQNLIDTIPDPELVRNIYSVAEEFNPNEAKLFQQRAIYEFKSPGGNINLSERFIRLAYEMEPKDPLISHTQSEIFLAKARGAKSYIEASKYLNTCKEISEKILEKFPPSIYPYHTLIKSLTFKLQLVLENGDEDTATVERLVKEIEKYLKRGNDKFPNHDYLIEAEARFQELLNNSPNALSLLERAFSINKSSPYLAIRLSTLYQKQGVEIEKSIEVISTALKGKPGDRDLNYQMAILLQQQDEFNFSEIIYYLKRSYTYGDSRFEQKFWCARFLYVYGEIKEAKKLFDELKKAKVDPKVKSAARGLWLQENAGPKIFEGQIRNVLASYAYIKRNVDGDLIFLSRYDEDNNFDWQYLKPYDRMKFNIAFSYHGPIAKEVTKL